jgi:hypothetical protein
MPRSPGKGTQLKKPDARYDQSDDSSAESGPSNRPGRIPVSRTEKEDPGGRAKKGPDILASHKPAPGGAAQPGGDEDVRVLCQYCGRKFLPDAAKRHIPVCGRVNQAKAGKKP